jgi:hypothetical protein
MAQISDLLLAAELQKSDFQQKVILYCCLSFDSQHEQKSSGFTECSMKDSTKKWLLWFLYSAETDGRSIWLHYPKFKHSGN